MKFKIFLLRKRGRSLPWREVQNGPQYVGEIISHTVDINGDRYRVVTLRPADPMAPSPVPDLYEPVLLGFSTLAFRLRGFERAEALGGAIGVVQEWHCEVP